MNERELSFVLINPYSGFLGLCLNCVELAISTVNTLCLEDDDTDLINLIAEIFWHSIWKKLKLINLLLDWLS